MMSVVSSKSTTDHATIGPQSQSASNPKGKTSSAPLLKESAKVSSAIRETPTALVVPGSKSIKPSPSPDGSDSGSVSGSLDQIKNEYIATVYKRLRNYRKRLQKLERVESTQGTTELNEPQLAALKKKPELVLLVQELEGILHNFDLIYSESLEREKAKIQEQKQAEVAIKESKSQMANEIGALHVCHWLCRIEFISFGQYADSGAKEAALYLREKILGEKSTKAGSNGICSDATLLLDKLLAGANEKISTFNCEFSQLKSLIQLHYFPTKVKQEGHSDPAKVSAAKPAPSPTQCVPKSNAPAAQRPLAIKPSATVGGKDTANSVVTKTVVEKPNSSAVEKLVVQTEKAKAIPTGEEVIPKSARALLKTENEGLHPSSDSKSLPTSQNVGMQDQKAFIPIYKKPKQHSSSSVNVKDFVPPQKKSPSPVVNNNSMNSIVAASSSVQSSSSSNSVKNFKPTFKQ